MKESSHVSAIQSVVDGHAHLATGYRLDAINVSSPFPSLGGNI